MAANETSILTDRVVEIMGRKPCEFNRTGADALAKLAHELTGYDGTIGALPGVLVAGTKQPAFAVVLMFQTGATHVFGRHKDLSDWIKAQLTGRPTSL